MTMATLQLYRNPYSYPNYGNIQAYGDSIPCTPVGTGLKNGTIKVKGSMSDFMSCNYLSIRRDGKTIFAWIEDARHSTANSFEIDYTVDAWRTYRNSVDLGTQFIERSNTQTYKRDDMLGSTRAYPTVTEKMHQIEGSSFRILVVQTRTYTGEQFSNTPVQPSPHSFYMRAYNVNSWASDPRINEFMQAITGNAEPENIVTIYSIPYADISDLPEVGLPVYGKSNTTIDGFKLLNEEHTMQAKLFNETDIDIGTNIDELMRVDHSVQLVVPDAGIINISDALLKQPGLRLRQDVDMFSGASNYMVVSDNGFNSQSIRGSSVSSIPIISDPMETYISQNQNALATSLIGDVASIGMGVAMTGASGGMGALAGSGAVMSGINGIVSRQAGISDMSSQTSNPPAFLGTALASGFNQLFWTIVTRNHVDNARHVHSNFGYPLEKVAPLQFPNNGYIKTQGCSVSSNGTVPRWAIDEINTMFNNGLYVH